MFRLYALAAYLKKIYNFIVNDEFLICFEYSFIFEKSAVKVIKGGGVKIILFCIFGNHLIVDKYVFPENYNEYNTI